MNELIIQIDHGGLGDHLFHSHLPRLAKTVGGYQKFYISSHSKYRSQQILDLVWKLNPHFDGFVDKPGKSLFAKKLKQGNLLDSLMLQLGLDDGKLMHEPEIFYLPKTINNIKNINIFDPNYVSYIGSIYPEIIKEYLTDNGINYSQAYSYKPIGKSNPFVGVNNFLERGSLEEYCNMIFSSKNFICYTSGSATLASALGKKSIVFYGAGQNNIFHHSSLHNYVMATLPMRAKIILGYTKAKEYVKNNIIHN